TFPLYLLAENIKVSSTVLDFPAWRDFTSELKKGYTHVGINFIVANVHKVRKMAQYVRRHYPDMKIMLGGYGTIIPNLKEMIPCDEVCRGEGVLWLRKYFGEDTEAPVVHPAIFGPAYEYIYGVRRRPTGGVILPGVGCENGCNFCITTHQFNKQYVSFLKTGKDIYDACMKSKMKIGSSGFSIMDENFLKTPDRARQLLEEMTKNNMPFVFDIFSSAEVIQKMGTDFLVRLGVRMVWIGVESSASAHEKTRGIDLKSLIKELQSKGISVNASAILFMEHHDRESLIRDIDWAIGLGSDLMQFMNYTPFPTTSLYERLDREGKIKNMDYRHLHGQGELAYEHPVFKNAADHHSILKNAFRKKYITDGPGVLNMAFTIIRGYRCAVSDFIERSRQKLKWNPTTLQYEKTDDQFSDEFMLLRIKMMQKMAKKIGVLLPAAMLFSPGMNIRRKTFNCMSLFRESLGSMSLKTRVASSLLILAGLFEAIRLVFSRIRGRESIIRQPSTRRVEYPLSALTVMNQYNKPVRITPLGMDNF
ncbi:MAG: B12-binding domain-containing radical SAM protein, partial [Spirochaetota bacterium]